MTIMIPYTCQDSKRKTQKFCPKLVFFLVGAIMRGSGPYFIQSIFGSRRPPQDAPLDAPKEIDGSLQLGVYYKCANSTSGGERPR
ncbi:MAG TPA: hypothetical protein DF289_12040 [Faecalibacterium sp.]|nr:hypothetical protein [Faecalibacterium sp.]